MIDPELLSALDAMEARLRTHTASLTERIMDRLTVIEGEVRNLRQEHSVTRDLVTRLPSTVLAVFEQPMLKRMTAIEARVSKLDGQP